VRADQAPTVDATDMQLIADVTAAVDARIAAALASAAAAAQGFAPPPAAPLRARLEASIAKVQKGLLERETEVRGRGRGPGARAGGWGGVRGRRTLLGRFADCGRSRAPTRAPPSRATLLHTSRPAGAPAHARRALRRAPAAARPARHRQV
jgi:hypothetical protein